MLIIKRVLKTQTFVNNSPTVIGAAFKLEVLIVLMKCSMHKKFQIPVRYGLAGMRL